MKSKLNEFTSLVFVMTALLVVGNSSLVRAQGQPLASSHCKSDERVVFSCPFKNGKTASLCASSDLSQTTGTLQYRYGPTGKTPELVFPRLGAHENPIYDHPAWSFHWSSFYPTSLREGRRPIPQDALNWSTKDMQAGDSVQISMIFTPIEGHPEINFVLEAQAGPQFSFQGSVLTISESGGREGRNIAMHRCIKEKTTEHLFSLKDIIKK